MDLVFLCGALRSGTSLVHLMLDSHSRLCNPGEFDFLFDYVKNSSKEPDIHDYISYLEQHRIFLDTGLQIDSSCNSYKDLLNSFIEQLSGNYILCLNIHRNFDVAFTYFPHANFIHILRDPRDVAKSSISMGWVGNTYYGVDHWIDTERSWDRLVSSASPSQLFDVRYERLIPYCQKVLASICQFLGVHYEHEMLDYHEGSTYLPPDDSLIEQWKHKQNVREIELVEYKAGCLMINRGYETSRGKINEPDSYELLRLWFSNKRYRYLFSIRRYGISLTILQKLIAAFPNFPRSKIYRRRLNQIKTKYLR